MRAIFGKLLVGIKGYLEAGIIYLPLRFGGGEGGGTAFVKR